MDMSNMYLRNRADGTIYGYHPILAENPKCELVTEEQAFPERFVNKGLVARAAKVHKDKGKDAGLVIETSPPSAPGSDNPELDADASRNLNP